MDDLYNKGNIFKIIHAGIWLITVMPGDIVATITFGNILGESSVSIFYAIPFFFSVALLCASPLFIYLIMGK